MADFYDFIQQVKRSNDIVEVIGSYLELRQRGTNFFARCPFHGEKTGSFCVNRDKQFFYCFGCHESGDVITFVEKYQSCSRMEAIEILAKRAGLKMPEFKNAREDKDYAELRKQRETCLSICKDTAIFYWKNLYAPQGEIARNYMQKRGFDTDTLKKFGIGYSPDMYSLVDWLTSRCHSIKDCLMSGVLQKTRDGKPFDALAGRLIVPVFNMSGQVIAFGGRGLDKKTIEFGKYKNTQDTPLFNKRDNLFALNLAKEQKQQTALPNIVVVEGYMDVIAMYQAGFRRAVASMGTSLTVNQAKLLSRLTDTVYICYDGDAAGQKATVRGLDILDEAGLEVLVMSVPENLDPDEYIKKYGAEKFEELVKAALPLPDYKLHLLEQAFPIGSDDPATRNNAMPKYIVGAIKMLKQLDDARQAQYMNAISLKTGYSVEYLRRKLESEVANKPVPAETAQLSNELMARYFVAACILNNQDFATIDEKPYCETAFLSNLYDYILDCRKKHEEPRLDMLYTVCPNGTKEEYDQILSVDFSPSRREKNEKYFYECRTTIKIEGLKMKREQLLRRLKSNPEEAEQLTRQIEEINKKIIACAKE